MSRQYNGKENLGLVDAQRQTLIAALRDLGDKQSKYPNYRNHWWTRQDNRAIIYEGKFINDEWITDSINNKLANIFNVGPSSIEASSQATQYGSVETFSRNGDKLRMIAFGGLLAT